MNPAKLLSVISSLLLITMAVSSHAQAIPFAKCDRLIDGNVDKGAWFTITQIGTLNVFIEEDKMSAFPPFDQKTFIETLCNNKKCPNKINEQIGSFTNQIKSKDGQVLRTEQRLIHLNNTVASSGFHEISFDLNKLELHERYTLYYGGFPRVEYDIILKCSK